MVGMMRTCSPDFLAVDDPMSSIEVSSRDGSCEIGTATGLTEKLAPRVFARENPWQVPRLLVIVSVLQNGRGCQKTDSGASHGDGVYAGELLFHHRIQSLRQVLSKPLRWPRGHAPTRLREFGTPLDQ